MLRKALWWILLIPLLLANATAQAEESGPRRVEALLTLRYDPDSRAVLWPEIEALLRGSPRGTWPGGPVALLAQPPDTYRMIEVLREDVDEPGILCARVNLESKLKDPALTADRLLDALVARVSLHVRERAEVEKRDLVSSAAELVEMIDERTARIAAGRAEGALPWPLSAAAFYENKLDRRADVRRELADLELDAATLEARRKALATQYEQLLEREAALAARTGNLDKAWGVILDARERLVVEVRAQVEAGNAGPIDVAMATEELAQARIQRATALREMLAPSAARQDLEAAMLGLEVDAAALEATRSYLQVLEAKLTEQLEKGKGDVLRIARLEDEAQVLRERLLRLRDRLAAWQAPTIDVIRLD